MLWNDIRQLAGCTAFSKPGLLLLRIPNDDTRWLIGPYTDLAAFATQLRHDASSRDALGAAKVRLGLRATDVAPVGDRAPRFGAAVTGGQAGTNFQPQRTQTLAQPVRSGAAPPNRVTDQLQNVSDYWSSQTPQSHHIVEYNNLHTLGASQRHGPGEMNHAGLPAVLLAAEFHQRYISSALKPTHALGKAALAGQAAQRYRTLYTGSSALFQPLWEVSRLILARAGIATT